MKKEEKSVMLKVAKANPQDAGREIARVDTATMRKLGVISGDVIEMEGKNIARAIVYPEDPQSSGESIIRIGENIMAKAGVAIEDKVRVKKAKVKEAKRITLEPTQPVGIVGGERYLGSVTK